MTPIEEEFCRSWDRVEEFYREFPDLDAVFPFLAALRAAGFDRTLRAGQSMTTLMLSRSRRHGLRDNQPYVAFKFHDGGMVVDITDRMQLALDRMELTPEVEAILRRLVESPID